MEQRYQFGPSLILYLFLEKLRKEDIMKRIVITWLLALGLFTTCAALADCQCVCMNGEVQAICSNSIDMQPICAPRVCPITPPSIEPIQSPRVPPIGTSNCSEQQVYNEYSHNYVWKEICY